MTDHLKDINIARSCYDTAYTEGKAAVHPFAIYTNPYRPPLRGSDHDRFAGYRDGFRTRCFQLRLQFPTCTPLYSSPLSKSDQ